MRVCVCVCVCVLPLVMGHGHGADSCVAAWVREQLFEVVDLPDGDHASVSARQQVLAVPTQVHGLAKRDRGYAYYSLFNELRVACSGVGTFQTLQLMSDVM